MLFSYSAIDRRGARLTETLEAADLAGARQELMQRGLYVLNLQPSRSPAGGWLKGRKPPSRQAARLAATPGEGEAPAGEGEAPAEPRKGVPAGVTPGARNSELMLFARLMAMLQKAGASVVPAIQSIREQPGRAAWQALLDDLATSVEGGATLQEALSRHPNCFPGIMRSLIGAGEATGSLAEAFTRLADLLEARQRIRKRIIGALGYPCVLLLLAAGVVTTMTLFVLPRFATLFGMLNAQLPAITRYMLAMGTHLKTWWPAVLGLPIAAVVALILWSRTQGGRATLGRLILRVPLLGRAVAGVLLSRLLLVWSALLRSHVSVLDAIAQTRDLTANPVFVRLIADVEQAVTEGRSISGVLKQYAVVPPPVVSALATGEESGRLGESMEFVGLWVEEDTNGLIAALTRVLEPSILIVMGLVVGSVCVSLFLPLFDLATAAG